MHEPNDPRIAIWNDVLVEYARYAAWHVLLPKSRRDLPVRKFDPKNPRPIVQDMVDAVLWLNTTFKEACMCWQRIRDLLPESVWLHYGVMEYEGMREQIDLAAAQKELTRVWAKRPAIFKRSTSYAKSKRPTKEAEYETDSENETTA